MSPEGRRSSREHKKLLRCNLPLHNPENVLAFVFRSFDHHTVSGSDEEFWDSQTSCLKSEVPYNSNSPSKLLEMFLSVNKTSLNKKISESLDDIRLVGWIAPYTLLLNGCSDDLNVLKTAWSHRMLESPRGFLLEDVGIVKNFDIESIPHVQFIPLASALYDAVKELERNGECTTRDSIIRYMKDVYHDVRIPEESVVHKCLGNLIEQRRIYHNGVGYHALIDNSPLALKKSDKNMIMDARNLPSYIGNMTFNGDILTKSNQRKMKPSLSSDSSNDKCSKNVESHEEQLCLQKIDYHLKSSKTLPWFKKTNKKKGTSKKKSRSCQSQGSSSFYKDSSEEQEVKIIDISSEASSIRYPYERHPKEFDQHFKNSPLVCIRNINNIKNANAAIKTDKKFPRRKTQRSRSFTEPCKLRTKNRMFKHSDTDSDFPLRRAIGVEELQKVRENEMKYAHEIQSKDSNVKKNPQNSKQLSNFDDNCHDIVNIETKETNNNIEGAINLSNVSNDGTHKLEQQFLKRINKEENLTFFCVIAKDRGSTSRTVQKVYNDKD